MKKNKEFDGEESEDVVFEEENTENKKGFPSGNKKEEKLKEKIRVLEQEKNEYLDGWQRARAEMVNLKKNHLEEKKLFTSIGKESFLSEIIPVLDNFDAAFSNKEAWEKVDQGWRVGIEYIYSQFKMVLENNGVEQFGEVGKDFDEAKYLSVESVETKDKKNDGKIFEVVQMGYKIGNKILREGKVKVFVKK